MLEPIVARFAPEQVWLFGSRARGDAGPTSDWDFLVVVPDSVPHEACVEPLSAGESDIVLVRRSDFARMTRYAGSLCRTVALEGALVHGIAVPPNPMVPAYLQAAGEDLDAARRLLIPPASRLASHHLQQAAEKLTKAVLSARGIHTTREHRIAILATSLDVGDPWRTKLSTLSHLDRFATAFRYPGTTGRLSPGEDPPKAQADLDTIAKLIDEAHGEVGVGR